MKILKCDKGHFFDTESYKVCPHCGADAVQNSKTAATCSEEGTQKKGHGLFKRKIKVSNTNVDSNTELPKSHEDYSGSDSFDDSKKRILSSQVVVDNNIETYNRPEDNLTQPLLYNSGNENNNSRNSIYSNRIKKLSETVKKDDGDELNDSNSNDSAYENVQDLCQKDSLKNAIKNASASSEGKTLSYFNAFSSKIRGAQDTSLNRGSSEPVVGWLICIGGVHFGESFSIISGANSIGRSAGNRIVLEKDQAISREKHTILTFEPKQQRFYIGPGESSGLTYVNNDFITDTVRMNDRDIIEIGSTRLMLIQLCGNNFSWQEYIE